MSWAQPPEGLEFTFYDVIDPTMRGGIETAGTEQDAARWKVAHDAYRSLLRDAEEVVRYAHGVRCKPGFMVDMRSVRLYRYGLMPNRRARSRRLFAACEAQMRKAEAAYRPLLEEIEGCIALAAADSPPPTGS
ncbi:hypothetical protein [Kitasatospora sp. NPDC101183]|uniref:hypothetical protein n=1 Tax=Kitasatospora sp. NPDC101183 TaxID=3364100 RepID=UPI0037FD2B85